METMRTNVKVKVALGHWTRKMNYEGVKYRGHWIDFVFWHFWSTHWKHIVSFKLHWLTWRNGLHFTPKPKGRGIAKGWLPFFVFYIPNFLKFILQKHIFFSLFIWNVTLFLSRIQLPRSQLPKHIVCLFSLFFSAFEKRRGFIHSRIQLNDIMIFGDRVINFEL